MRTTIDSRVSAMDNALLQNAPADKPAIAAAPVKPLRYAAAGRHVWIGRKYLWGVIFSGLVFLAFIGNLAWFFITQAALPIQMIALLLLPAMASGGVLAWFLIRTLRWVNITAEAMQLVDGIRSETERPTRLEPLSSEEFSEIADKWTLLEAVGMLREAGYRRLGDFRCLPPLSRSPMVGRFKRIMLSGDGRVVAIIYHFKAKLAWNIFWGNYLMLSSESDDGREWVTRSGPGVIVHDPHIVVRRMPYKTTPSQVLETHAVLLKSAEMQGARFIKASSLEEVVAGLERGRLKLLGHLQKRGWLRAEDIEREAGLFGKFAKPFAQEVERLWRIECAEKSFLESTNDPI